MPFVSTLNKDVIRSKYDKRFIKIERKRKKRELTYFGLPGTKMLDVLEWKECLGTIIGVERDDIIKRQLLLDTVFANNITKFQLLTGDIDDILIEGKDKYGTSPLAPTFDIVNLDYEGGLVYKDLKGDSKRVTAMKKLFERQSIGQRDFLLFLTFNSRNRDVKEFEITLEQIDKQLASYGIDASVIIDWYKGERYDFKIKIYIPYLIDILAVRDRFTCNFYPAVTYKGSSNIRMIHFAVQLKYIKSVVGRPPGKSLIDIINLPMKEAKNGRFQNIRIPTVDIKI